MPSFAGRKLAHVGDVPLVPGRRPPHVRLLEVLGHAADQRVDHLAVRRLVAKTAWMLSGSISFEADQTRAKKKAKKKT